MVTVGQVINDLLYPILGFLGVVLRAFGALGAGIVIGAVLRDTVLYKTRTRFYVPLIFLGVVGLFGIAAWGQWSSPGTVAMLGIGLFVGYMLLARASVTSEESDMPEAEEGG